MRWMSPFHCSEPCQTLPFKRISALMYFDWDLGYLKCQYFLYMTDCNATWISCACVWCFFFCKWKLSVWSFVFFLLVLSILSNTSLSMGFAYFLLWRLCPLYNEKHCCVKEAIILTVKIWWSGHKIIYSGNPIKFIRNLQNRKFHGNSNKFDNFAHMPYFDIKWGAVTLFVLRGACNSPPKLPIFSLTFIFLWCGGWHTW